MLIIAYYNANGYRNMVIRLANLCHEWDIPFKSYTDRWLEKQPEYKDYHNVFAAAKGGGYWAWKPMIILDALKSSDEVLYLDSSVVPTGKDPILNMLKFTDKISAAKYSERQGKWTKRKCFTEMDCDSMEYWDALQVWAGVVSVKREGIPIVEEWKKWCMNYEVISDCPSTDNLEGFKDHRHDQSILTNLLIRHKQSTFESSDFYDIVDYSPQTEPKFEF
jgi:hypothetical protein